MARKNPFSRLPWFRSGRDDAASEVVRSRVGDNRESTSQTVVAADTAPVEESEDRAPSDAGAELPGDAGAAVESATVDAAGESQTSLPDVERREGDRDTSGMFTIGGTATADEVPSDYAGRVRDAAAAAEGTAIEDRVRQLGEREPAPAAAPSDGASAPEPVTTRDDRPDPPDPGWDTGPSEPPSDWREDPYWDWEQGSKYLVEGTDGRYTEEQVAAMSRSEYEAAVKDESVRAGAGYDGPVAGETYVGWRAAEVLAAEREVNQGVLLAEGWDPDEVNALSDEELAAAVKGVADAARRDAENTEQESSDGSDQAGDGEETAGQGDEETEGDAEASAAEEDAESDEAAEDASTGGADVEGYDEGEADPMGGGEDTTPDTGGEAAAASMTEQYQRLRDIAAGGTTIMPADKDEVLSGGTVDTSNTLKDPADPSVTTPRLPADVALTPGNVDGNIDLPDDQFGSGSGSTPDPSLTQDAGQSVFESAQSGDLGSPLIDDEDSSEAATTIDVTVGEAVLPDAPARVESLDPISGAELPERTVTRDRDLEAFGSGSDLRPDKIDAVVLPAPAEETILEEVVEVEAGSALAPDEFGEWDEPLEATDLESTATGLPTRSGAGDDGDDGDLDRRSGLDDGFDLLD